MKISIPEGLQIDAEVGATTELLAKFKVTEDNQLSLVSLDGVAVEEEEEDEKEPKESTATEDEMSEEELNMLMSGISGDEQTAAPSAEEYIAKKR
jgi:hypothetical protein